MKLFRITFWGFAAVFALRGFTLEQDTLAIQDALRAGDFDTAGKLLDTALAQHPQEGGLFNLRGVMRAQRSDLKGARTDFSEAVRLAPKLIPAWQNLARACQLDAARDAAARGCAMRAWQRVAAAKATDEEAHASLARLDQQQGKRADSLRELDRLPPEAAAKPANLLLRCADLASLDRQGEALSVAHRLTEQGDYSETDFAALEGAFADPKAAPVTVELVQALDTKQAVGMVSLKRLAIAFEQLNRPADARQTLERLARLDPTNVAHLLELARLANQSKDHEGAIGYLAHARDLEPNNAQIHYLFAMIATEMELPIEARASLQKALTLEPANAVYNYAMGFVILSTRDAATAAGYFEKFVKARPHAAKGHYALGIAYYSAGDYAKSKAELEGVRADPEVAGGAEYYLGRISRQEDDMPGATRHLRRAIELMPTYAESHTELARVAMSEGDLKGAEEELDKAVKLDPNSFQANSQLLVIYRRNHDARAVAQDKRVKELDEERSKRTDLMLRTIEVRP